MPGRFWSATSWAGFASIILLTVALACTREIEVVRTVEVPGQTVEVIRTVLVPGQTIQVVRTVLAPVEIREVIREVPGAPIEVVRIVEVEVPVRRVIEIVVTPTPEPVLESAGGENIYQIGMFEEPTTRNFWSYFGGPSASVWSGYVTDGISTQLYDYSDQRFDWIPILADGFPTALVKESVDGTEFWTTEVNLKQGVEWSDGVEITVEDFIFTVNTVQDLALGGNFASNIDPAFVDHVDALDTHKAKIYFKATDAEGDPQTIGLSVWQFGLAFAPILAKHFWEPIVEQAKIEGGDDIAAVQEALFAVQPEGEPTAGGFTFTKWEPGAFFENTTDPNYFRKGVEVTEYENGSYQEVDPGRGFDVQYYGDATGAKVLNFEIGPHVDSELFRIYGNQDTAILALTKGDVDYIFNPLGLEKGFQNRIASEPSVEVITNPSNGFRYLGFNVRKAPMNFPEFRQAIATVIDKEFVTSKILQGSAFPIDAVVPEGNGFWHNPNVRNWGQNANGESMTRGERIAQAVDLLKSAGFTYDVEPVVGEDDDTFLEIQAEGLKMPDGTPVPQLELLSVTAGYDPLRSTFAIWIERWLNDIGIPARAKLTGFSSILDVLFGDTVQEDLDMWILGWDLSLFPDYLEGFFNSRHAPENEDFGFNFGGYANPEFDTLSQSLLNETELDAARASAFELQEFLANDVPYVILYATPILDTYRPSRVVFPYKSLLGGMSATGVNGLQQETLIK